MAKIHVTKRGMPAECKATVGVCPLGDHYDTLREAVDAIEAQNKQDELPPAAKKATAPKLSAIAQTVVDDEDLPSQVRDDVLSHSDDYETELRAYAAAKEATYEDDITGTELRRRRREVSNAATAVVRKGMEIYAVTDSLPKSLRDQIWDKAWSDGHDSGYNQVANEYEELADFTHRAYAFGRSAVTDKLETYAEQLDTGIYPAQDPPGIVHSKQDKSVARKLRAIINNEED